MDISKYFETLTTEMLALKDRVRLYIENRHWQSDGEWKESVLRAILRRHLPADIGVGRGFIIKPETTSTQLDVLLYDKNKPVLFQDGEFVMVTPDATRGVIEVKTRVSPNQYEQVLLKLADVAELVSSSLSQSPRFFGLFAYEPIPNHQDLLEELCLAVRNQNRRVIHCMTFGPSTFVRYWPLAPTDPRPRHEYRRWHAYQLENKAPAYFVHNVVDHLSPQWADQNNQIWYPEEGKEDHLVGEIGLA
jgi:hypothetical protein